MENGIEPNLCLILQNVDQVYQMNSLNQFRKKEKQYNRKTSTGSQKKR